MKKNIKKLYSLIKCYRSNGGKMMTKKHIKTWIKQFDKKDRIFILDELYQILIERYISKKSYIEFLKSTFFARLKDIMEIGNNEKLFKKELYKCYFVRHQPKGKSQSIVLKILEKILEKDFKININDCGKKKVKYIIYLDDILCTGDTLFKGFAGKDSNGGFFRDKILNKSKTNFEIIKKKQLHVIWVFHTIHKQNFLNTKIRLENEFEGSSFVKIDQLEIDNDYKNPESALQFIYPKKNIANKKIRICKKQIKNKVEKNYPLYTLTENFYREEKFPKKEQFFSSKKNRDKFEKIILKKSIEIYNQASSNGIRMRPLGNCQYTNMSFGFGTLIFTWRNVPFNTPLIFWYEKKNVWYPLFKRNWSEY